MSFLALVVLWREPRVHGAQAGRPLPSWLATTLDHEVFRWILRLIGIAGTTLIALAAWVGPDDALNPTAGTVYVLFWVGLLAVASLIFGPVWRMLNPLRTLHLMFCAAIGRDPRQSLVRRSWRRDHAVRRGGLRFTVVLQRRRLRGLLSRRWGCCPIRLVPGRVGSVRPSGASPTGRSPRL